MDLRHLTDRCLLEDTLKLARQEREMLTHVLHHFRELERRRLYNGHSSLFDYATKACAYSEDQACRRIAAMRLLESLPELEEKIESGAINLSHVGLAKSMFKNEKKHGNDLRAEEKLAVFEAIAGTPSREAQRRLAQMATAPPAHRDSIRPLGDGTNAVHLRVHDETLAKVEKLKGLLAHEAPGLSLGELLDRLCDLGLQQWDPAKAPKRRTKNLTKAEISRRVWRRDRNKCTVCGSQYFVQEDHIVPKSLGGKYTIENMRLLCRNCNQRAAIEKLGLDKMERYFNSRVGPDD